MTPENTIEKEFFDLVQKEIATRKHVIEPYVNQNKVEVGKIIYKQVQKEQFVQNLLVLPVILGKVMPYIDDEHYIQILITILKHKSTDNRMRYQVIQKLGWRPTEAREAMPIIAEHLTNKGELGAIAAVALGEIGYENFEEILPNLLYALKNGEYYISRMNAARQLFNNEEYLPKVLPHLIEALAQDIDFRLRQKIARRFGEINQPAVKKALIAASKKDDHPVVRTVAKTSLADLEKLGKK